MSDLFEVRARDELTQSQIDRYTEVKTATLGYFEAQLVRPLDDGTHFTPASLFTVADAAEADMLVAALQHEIPDAEFEVTKAQVEMGTKLMPSMI